MSSDLPVPYKPEQISNDVYVFSQGLQQYLNHLKLPTDSVLVAIQERGRVITNLPVIVETLTPHQKERAHYISKFIASCSVGLFDAALNYLWNETILNLRDKVTRFDLDYFYDNIITDTKRRTKFKTEDDLKGLADWELIQGCRDTGIVTEIGCKHLDYIREMRNFASAAHPNHTNITGFQLLTWMETCIIEVLSKEPSAPALEVRRLLQNIRSETLGSSDARGIIACVRGLPKDLVGSLLKSVFGLYTDLETQSQVRSNIELLAKGIWGSSDEVTKHELGLKYGYFSVNGDVGRKSLAHQFLELVDGLGYLTEDQIVINIQESLEALLDAHYGYNNFYTEEPRVRTLIKQFPPNGTIPEPIRPYLVEVTTLCKLGNRYGVSDAAESYYDNIIDMYNDDEITEFIKLLKNKSVLPQFEYPRLVQRYQDIAMLLKSKTRSETLRKSLEIISNSSIPDLQSGKTYSRIRQMIS